MLDFTTAPKTGIEGTGQMWGREEWFTLWLCGQNVGSIVGYSRAVSQLQGIARTNGVDIKAARRTYLESLENLVQAELHAPVANPDAIAAQEPQLAAAPVARGPRPKPAPCHFYRAIRRLYAIANEIGLSTENEEAMRAAFSRALGRVVESREALTGSDWMFLGDKVKSRQLAW